MRVMTDPTYFPPNGIKARALPPSASHPHHHHPPADRPSAAPQVNHA